MMYLLFAIVLCGVECITLSYIIGTIRSFIHYNWRTTLAGEGECMNKG